MSMLSPPPTTQCTGKRRLWDGASPDATPLLSIERLPAKTMLYRAVRRGCETGTGASVGIAGCSTNDPRIIARHTVAPGEALVMRAPASSAVAQVCEYTLIRPILVARGGCTMPPDEALVQQCADGWRAADGVTICLRDPESLLQLVDDDKMNGLTQALLPDLFLRGSMSNYRVR